MKRKVLTKKFKLEAVRLLESSGRAPPEVAREPGIHRNQLYSGSARSVFISSIAKSVNSEWTMTFRLINGFSPLTIHYSRLF